MHTPKSLRFSAVALIAFLAQPGHGQTLYYDTNGPTPGTSTSSTQNLTDFVWTTDSNGSTATIGFASGSDLVFSATDGVNVGTGAQNVTVAGAQSVDSITTDNGTVTLFGTSSPNLSIGAGGITQDSPDGALTLDSSLGAVTLSASQEWSVGNSTALNVNSGVTGSGITLTTGGTGTGNVNFNGVISGGVSLNVTGANDTVFLNSESNSFNGAIAVNGGTLVYQNQGSLNGNNITLSNGGELASDTEVFATGNDVLSNNITLGTGGGKIADVGTSGTDMIFSGKITGGTGLTIAGGDFITQNDGTSNVGTLTVSAARLLFGSAGIFGNNATVDVKGGAILDSGWNGFGGTLNNAITLEDGSALENRGNDTITLTDVILPSTGTVTMGSDDVGGGSIVITNAIDLTGALTLDINGKNSGTGVYLNGPISGSGSLTISPGPTGISALFLGGNSDYTGPTTINSMVVQANSSTGFGNSAITSNSSTIYLPAGGTFSNSITANTGQTTIVENGANLNLTGPLLTNANNGYFYFANTSTTGNMTVGSIDFANDTIGTRNAFFDEATGAGSITLAGTYTSLGANTSDPSVSNGGSLVFGDNGNGAASYYLSPTADFSKFETNGLYDGRPTIDLDAGTLYVENSTFVAGQIFGTDGYPGVNHTVALVGAQNILAGLYFDEKHGPALIGQFTMSQSTADESTWAGPVTLDSTEMIVSAVDGGRLDITGQINGSSPAGLVKTGAGTVVFGSLSGNTYGLSPASDSVDAGAPPSPIDIDIQQGTLLVKNGAGGALGNNSGTVNIEAGARLGGSGSITQQVVAMDPSAVLMAGDPGQANLGIKPTIGSLSLGGLSATSGLTMAFKFDANGTAAGVDNDAFTIGPVDLGGTVTIDFSTLNGFLQTGVPYFLASGTGTWTAEQDLKFKFDLPNGYALAEDHLFTDGTVGGFDYDTEDDAMVVVFELAPEPSTYALFGLGLLGLLFVYRRSSKVLVSR